jgi:hypothetical protein
MQGLYKCNKTSDPESLRKQIKEIQKINVQRMRRTQTQDEIQTLQNMNRFMDQLLKYLLIIITMNFNTRDPVQQYSNDMILEDQFNIIKNVEDWTNLVMVIGKTCGDILNDNIHTLHANTKEKMRSYNERHNQPKDRQTHRPAKKRDHSEDYTTSTNKRQRRDYGMPKQTSTHLEIGKHTESCKEMPTTSDPKKFVKELENLMRFIDMQTKDKSFMELKH